MLESMVNEQELVEELIQEENVSAPVEVKKKQQPADKQDSEDPDQASEDSIQDEVVPEVAEKLVADQEIDEELEEDIIQDQ